MLNVMAAKQHQHDNLVTAREAMRIFDKDRGTIIRWGREGRIKIAYQMPGGNGAFLYDRASVEALAAELADTDAEAAS
jgi:hypothetical protein